MLDTNLLMAFEITATTTFFSEMVVKWTLVLNKYIFQLKGVDRDLIKTEKIGLYPCVEEGEWSTRAFSN